MKAQVQKRMGQHIAELEAEVRHCAGSRSVRRLRKQGMLPAVLYGHNQPNVLLAVSEKEFLRHFRAGHRIMYLSTETGRETGMVKGVQYDNLGDKVLHVDFGRISLKERVHMRIPVETIGVAKGAAAGGVFELVRKELDVEGPATDIPEVIELHVSDMVVGDVIRVAEVPLPETCRVLHAEVDDVVVAIHAPRREAAPAVAAPAEEAEVEEKKKEEEQSEKAEK